MSADRRVEKLRPDHNIEGFDCGREELNRYLLRYAWQNQQAGAAQTYVGLVGDSVIGYHTLAVGQVAREEAPERLTKGVARHPVPIMLLARLAVDRHWQGQGVGKALLKDAMQRTLRAAEIAGIHAFAVHAKDEDARNFYQKFDFMPSPTDPMHLFVLLKDVRRIVGPDTSGRRNLPAFPRYEVSEPLKVNEYFRFSRVHTCDGKHLRRNAFGPAAK